MAGTTTRRARSLALLLFVAALAFAGIAWLRDAGAWAIVKAPSYDGPTVAGPVPEDVVGVIRAEVGPPTATLEAWILDPGDARATTLVLHGIRDDKRSMLGVGRALRERGHRAILVDLRGHGASSGRFLTYGVVESRDLSQLLDQLEALGLVVGPVGVYGPSYGGAVAIQASAHDPRIRRVVSVSTFASLREVVPPQAAFAVPWVGSYLPDVLLDAVVDDAGALGGFSPDAADTRAAIARTGAEILLIHGLDDRNVPFENARALVEACPTSACQLVELEHADHPGALGHPETLRRAVEFLTRDALARAAPPG
ncbi:MAG: alpha/beta fold hydrolase [Myxococcales bacterium]|nr:alpha/beta fold hydrolase [Myxococcales bacterium]